MKEEKFPHTKVSQTRPGRGIFGTSEGSQKANWRTSSTEIMPNHTYELRCGSWQLVPSVEMETFGRALDYNAPWGQELSVGPGSWS